MSVLLIVGPLGIVFVLLILALTGPHWTDREEGFTLIELMISLLIISVIIAIAMPSFLAAQQRAHDSKVAYAHCVKALAAQSSSERPK